MLEVLDLDELAQAPDISGDEHVPLMIRWTLAPAVVWQAVWPDGRVCCEIKIGRVGGRINGLTVLNPPAATDTPVGSADVVEQVGLPVVNLAVFDPDPDLMPQRSVIQTRCSPVAWMDEMWLEIRFREEGPIRWASTGPFGFGIDTNDKLISMRVLTAEVTSLGSL